jgi:hypothetical protein
MAFLQSHVLEEHTNSTGTYKQECQLIREFGEASTHTFIGNARKLVSKFPELVQWNEMFECDEYLVTTKTLTSTVGTVHKLRHSGMGGIDTEAALFRPAWLSEPEPQTTLSQRCTTRALAHRNSPAPAHSPAPAGPATLGTPAVGTPSLVPATDPYVQASKRLSEGWEPTDASPDTKRVRQQVRTVIKGLCIAKPLLWELLTELLTEMNGADSNNND